MELKQTNKQTNLTMTMEVDTIDALSGTNGTSGNAFDL